MEVRDCIYEYIDSGKLDSCIVDGVMDCHCSIYELENMLEGEDYYDGLIFLYWDEDRYDMVREEMREESLNFGKLTNELFRDILDGYVNGHSFMKYGNTYIDPHLYYKGVKDSEIQNFCRYFEKFLIR